MISALDMRSIKRNIGVIDKGFGLKLFSLHGFSVENFMGGTELTFLEHVNDGDELAGEKSSVHIHKEYSAVTYNINVLLKVLMSGSKGLGQAVKVLNGFAAPGSILEGQRQAEAGAAENRAAVSLGRGKAHEAFQEKSNSWDSYILPAAGKEAMEPQSLAAQGIRYSETEGRFILNGKGYNRIGGILQELFLRTLLHKEVRVGKSDRNLFHTHREVYFKGMGYGLKIAAFPIHYLNKYYGNLKASRSLYKVQKRHAGPDMDDVSRFEASVLNYGTQVLKAGMEGYKAGGGSTPPYFGTSIFAKTFPGRNMGNEVKSMEEIRLAEQYGELFFREYGRDESGADRGLELQDRKNNRRVHNGVNGYFRNDFAKEYRFIVKNIVYPGRETGIWAAAGSVGTFGGYAASFGVKKQDELFHRLWGRMKSKSLWKVENLPNEGYGEMLFRDYLTGAPENYEEPDVNVKGSKGIKEPKLLDMGSVGGYAMGFGINKLKELFLSVRDRMEGKALRNEENLLVERPGKMLFRNSGRDISSGEQNVYDSKVWNRSTAVRHRNEIKAQAWEENYLVKRFDRENRYGQGNGIIENRGLDANGFDIKEALKVYKRQEADGKNPNSSKEVKLEGIGSTGDYAADFGEKKLYELLLKPEKWIEGNSLWKEEDVQAGWHREMIFRDSVVDIPEGEAGRKADGRNPGSSKSIRSEGIGSTGGYAAGFGAKKLDELFFRLRERIEENLLWSKGKEVLPESRGTMIFKDSGINMSVREQRVDTGKAGDGMKTVGSRSETEASSGRFQTGKSYLEREIHSKDRYNKEMKGMGSTGGYAVGFGLRKVKELFLKFSEAVEGWSLRTEKRQGAEVYEEMLFRDSWDYGLKGYSRQEEDWKSSKDTKPVRLESIGSVGSRAAGFGAAKLSRLFLGFKNGEKDIYPNIERVSHSQAHEELFFTGESAGIPGVAQKVRVGQENEAGAAAHKWVGLNTGSRLSAVERMHRAEKTGGQQGKGQVRESIGVIGKYAVIQGLKKLEEFVIGFGSRTYAETPGEIVYSEGMAVRQISEENAKQNKDKLREIYIKTLEWAKKSGIYRAYSGTGNGRVNSGVGELRRTNSFVIPKSPDDKPVIVYEGEEAHGTEREYSREIPGEKTVLPKNRSGVQDAADIGAEQIRTAERFLELLRSKAFNESSIGVLGQSHILKKFQGIWDIKQIKNLRDIHYRWKNRMLVAPGRSYKGKEAATGAYGTSYRRIITDTAAAMPALREFYEGNIWSNLSGKFINGGPDVDPEIKTGEMYSQELTLRDNRYAVEKEHSDNKADEKASISFETENNTPRIKVINENMEEQILTDKTEIQDRMPDISKLAEQVYKKLENRLRIERQRRGLFR